MAAIVVRYRVRPERAEENQRLIEAVFDELAAASPRTLDYTVHRLSDGTFIHLADVGDGPNPLNQSAAFQAFVEGIQERCEPGCGPDAQPATVVGKFSSR